MVTLRDQPRVHSFTKINHETRTKHTCVNLRTTRWGVQAISYCPPSCKNASVIDKCYRGSLMESGPLAVNKQGKYHAYKNKYCSLWCVGYTNICCILFKSMEGSKI